VTTLRAYLSSVLIAFDLFGNVVLLGRWYTISSRAMLGKLRGDRWWSLLYRLLDRLQANHCEEALRGDIARSEESLRDLRGPPTPSA
jgi:hypothetical protein